MHKARVVPFLYTIAFDAMLLAVGVSARGRGVKEM